MTGLYLSFLELSNIFDKINFPVNLSTTPESFALSVLRGVGAVGHPKRRMDRAAWQAQA